jgi:hypothetical protein
MPIAKKTRVLSVLTRQRIAHVQSLMASMATERAITDSCAHAWGCTPRSVREIIRLASEDFARRGSGVAEEERRSLLRQSAEAIHLRAVTAAADPKLAPKDKASFLKVQLNTLEFLAKLDGVHRPVKVEVGGENGEGWSGAHEFASA